MSRLACAGEAGTIAASAPNEITTSMETAATFSVAAWYEIAAVVIIKNAIPFFFREGVGMVGGAVWRLEPKYIGRGMPEIRINTRFGELSIDPSQVITFPGGVPGFEHCTRWKLLHEVNERGEPVAGVVVHLQALDDGAVSLSLTDPALFGVSCKLALTDDDAAVLKLEDPNDLLVLMTLSAREAGVRPRLESMYVNIAAPILINARSRIGMQKIIGLQQAPAAG